MRANAIVAPVAGIAMSWLLPAVAAPAPAASAGPPVAASPSAESAARCLEQIPTGKPRPRTEEEFPATGTAGHVVVLVFTVVHGKGERVDPSLVALDPTSPGVKQLRESGFILPDPAGPARLEVERRSDKDGNVSTTVRFPFVPLPEEAGRATMTLPPLPIPLSRASGDVISLCTEEHVIRVEAPTANTPEARPKDNPAARPQREVWALLRNLVVFGVAALATAAVLLTAGLLLGPRLRQLLPKKPPPPPRPPWELAREALFRIRNENLVEAGHLDEHYERVANTLREYLGHRYRFDGLESTTREILEHLQRFDRKPDGLDDIHAFLRNADLVKFARTAPSPEQCLEALDQAEHIVDATMPRRLAAGAPPPDAPPPSAPRKPEPPAAPPSPREGA